ncbi:hypothetical protein HGA91_05405 [candidate division WWE3 bacterium]|nr:hypothetical protein [candidate division WWE3 bacterium]
MATTTIAETKSRSVIRELIVSNWKSALALLLINGALLIMSTLALRVDYFNLENQIETASKIVAVGAKLFGVSSMILLMISLIVSVLVKTRQVFFSKYASLDEAVLADLPVELTIAFGIGIAHGVGTWLFVSYSLDGIYMVTIACVTVAAVAFMISAVMACINRGDAGKYLAVSMISVLGMIGHFALMLADEEIIKMLFKYAC